MQPVYEAKLKKLQENFQTLKSEFKWEHSLNQHLVALNYVMNDKVLNPERLKEAKAFVKENTGFFSPFRGNNLFTICGLIVSEKDLPHSRLKAMIDMVPMAKKAGFKRGYYLPIALYTLEKVYKGENRETFLNKAHLLYKEMRNHHPFLTGGDDYALAILLTNHGSGSEVIERNYRVLNASGFSKSNGLQMMSHILSFSDVDVTIQAERCKNIYETLKANKLKLYSDYYSAVALMSLLPEDNNPDLIEIAHYLNRQKGYKWLGKGMNVLIASALIAGESVNQAENGMVSATLQISIQSVIAAQQAAMIAATSAATTAAAASASS